MTQPLPDIRVVDFDTPVGSLVLSPTRKLPIHRADLGTFQLAQELAEQPANIGLQIACLKRIIPDATDEELRALKPGVINAIVQRALYQLDEVQRILGESSGASPASGTTDSPPATPTDTSAPVLPPGMG